MKTLLDGVLETPGYILKESVVNCFRLGGSKVLLLMRRHCIVYDREFRALETIGFEEELACCQEDYAASGEGFWLVFKPKEVTE